MDKNTGDKNIIKNFFKNNKALLFLLPVLLLLIVLLIIFYFMEKQPVAVNLEPTPTISDSGLNLNDDQAVEILPDIERDSNGKETREVFDPFELPTALKATIVFSDEESTAILETNGISYIVRTDDVVGDSQWTVEAIEKGRVTLKSGEKNTVLTLTKLNNQSVAAEKPEADRKGISIKTNEADIRDILSAIALFTNESILFSAEASIISLDFEAANTQEVFDYVLKASGLDYIKSGTTVIVGTRDTLNDKFFDSIALTRFNLKYIESDVLANELDTLGLNVKKITLDSNKSTIWIQGLPRDLAKVRELAGVLDRAENKAVETSEEGSAPNMALTPISLSYINAEQFNKLLKGMGLSGGISLESKPYILWIYGSQKDIQAIQETRSLVDTQENQDGILWNITAKNLSYLTASEVKSFLMETGHNVTIIHFPRITKTVWLQGEETSVSQALKMIEKVDIADNANSNTFFIYNLKNITAAEATKRLSQLELPSVNIYSFDFSQISKNIMIFCPQDYQATVSNYLRMMDFETYKIKMPVDYSNDSAGNFRLVYRRDLIVEMTGIPASSFTISANVSRDSTPHFILYLEESSEVIRMVKDLIQLIDNPTSDRQSESN